MRSPDGGVRPHWQVLDRALRAFGPGEMWRRWEQARQLIRQHGVTFNVYGDARGLERPWPLDPVPVVLAPEEFAAPRRRAWPSGPRCSTGCWPISTARGASSPRGCSRPRWSSPTRACCAPVAGIAPAGGRFLHFYAADLVRTRRGRAARARRPHPGAGGRGLRAGEPDRARARAARGVPRVRTRSGWRCSSGRCARRWPGWPRTDARTRASCCSPPGRSTPPTSSRRSWPSTSATRWSRGATSPCGRGACS